MRRESGVEMITSREFSTPPDPPADEIITTLIPHARAYVDMTREHRARIGYSPNCAAPVCGSKRLAPTAGST